MRKTVEHARSKEMNQKRDNQTTKEIAVTSQESRILEIIRSIDDGEMTIAIIDGKPTRIAELKKGIEL